VDRVLKALKYDGRTGWAVILGRLVLGWLQENLAPDDYDLIVANPTEPGRAVHHTELVLAAADREDLEDIWPMYPDALVKTGPTSQSGQRGTNWRTKWEAAQELRSVVEPAPWVTFKDMRVLLFDDVTTICGQMQVLGDMLAGWGASKIDGLVIARTGG
jgi:predicted amidophosphoribosyltransferase